MKTMMEVYDSVVETAEKNVVNDLINLMFDETAPEEELSKYYRAEVNREELVNDTVQRLLNDQQMLKFLTDNRETFKQLYGEKNALTDFNRTVQRSTGDDDQQGSVTGDDEGGSKEESVPSPYNKDEQGDNATGDSDSNNAS